MGEYIIKAQMNPAGGVIRISHRTSIWKTGLKRTVFC